MRIQVAEKFGTMTHITFHALQENLHEAISLYLQGLAGQNALDGGPQHAHDSLGFETGLLRVQLEHENSEVQVLQTRRKNKHTNE
jgi:hypothetical protein